MRLPILTLENPILRQKAEPYLAPRLALADPSLQHLIDNMVDTMRAANGLGLAAPQVGVRLRLITVEIAHPPCGPDSPPPFILINPEIVAESGGVEGVEACLSIPNCAGKVLRAQSITVRARTRIGQLVTLEADGLLARVIQHELDHLEGVLFIDRASKTWQIPN